MLSLFAAPKRFEGHVGNIQRNAIQSWLALGNSCEVILIGNDVGVAETAREFNLMHIPNVECNKYGTPIVSSIFEIAQQRASTELMCYINADIMLLDDFLAAIRRVDFSQFLVVGRRWDLDVVQPLDFSNEEWRTTVRNLLRREGKLQIPNAMDYFVFPKGTLGKLPRFAIGRPGWDNYVVYNTWKQGAPVIDATQSVTAVHQNHDYNHVPVRDGPKWSGPEAKINLKLMGEVKEYRFTSLDATHILTQQGLKRAFTKAHLRRKWRRIPMLHPRIAPFYWAVHRLLRVFVKGVRSNSHE